jgi:drug/metabolite transporter (DMT)-like permease
MPRARLLVLVVLTMIAFAGNSLLCRVALRNTQIDAASFTSIRLVSGAIALWLIVRLRDAARVEGAHVDGANWWSAFALFAYAVTFSFAYISLPAGTGACCCSARYEATMIAALSWRAVPTAPVAGLLLAFAGLVGLMLPGIFAPSLQGSLLMLSAGVAWGVYSLRGRGAGDATRTTAGNFLRAVPFAAILSIAAFPWTSLDHAGIHYAIVSGALTSGVICDRYTALGAWRAHAATVQLSVPVIAALGGVMFLDEHAVRLVIAAAAVLGGIALVVLGRRQAR